MDADEILPLTREAIENLLRSRIRDEQETGDLGRRRLPRWPFPGTVELWVPTSDGPDNHVLATLHDLNDGGMGLRCDVTLEPGVVLPVAIHQPEASFHGRATVRHCTPRGRGYHVGMEFKFD